AGSRRRTEDEGRRMAGEGRSMEDGAIAALDAAEGAAAVPPEPAEPAVLETVQAERRRPATRRATAKAAPAEPIPVPEPAENPAAEPLAVQPESGEQRAVATTDAGSEAPAVALPVAPTAKPSRRRTKA